MKKKVSIYAMKLKVHIYTKETSSVVVLDFSNVIPCSLSYWTAKRYF